jgi:glycosyltransferase involved in cell wall biosynthesis
MKIFTSTPVAFRGDSSFMTRDSGILCKGLLSIGVASSVIMPSGSGGHDMPEIRRADIADMRDANWWAALQLDALVFYGWGNPRYADIMRAVRAAGIMLIQNLDTAGLHSPYCGFSDWLQINRGKLFSELSARCALINLYRSARDFMPMLYESKRLRAIDDSDCVTCISPAAAEYVRRFAVRFGYPGLAEKIRVIPHAVNPQMRYTGETKEKTVVVVGRWEKEDEAQKDPRFMLRVLEKFLSAYPEWSAVVTGRGAPCLLRFCKNWNPSLRSRLVLHPFLDHERLKELYCASMVSLCASRHESFHIASAEAVCCGCSVVVADHPALASTGRFTTCGSGTLARERTPDCVADALCHEAAEWEAGRRAPADTSGVWIEELHADRVAARIADLVRNFRSEIICNQDDS